MTELEPPHKDYTVLPATTGPGGQEIIIFGEPDQPQTALTIGNAERLHAAITERLQGLDARDPRSATPEQTRNAMQVGGLMIDLLTEALRADSEAVGAILGFKGSLHTMTAAASRMHTDQTGQPFRETSYSGIGDLDVQGALKNLDAVKKKVEDQRWDGTQGHGVEAHGPTAHARKTTALAAVDGLRAIAEQRGVAHVSHDTATQVVEYLS